MPNKVKSIHFYFWDFCSEKITMTTLDWHHFIWQFVNLTHLYCNLYSILKNPKNQDGLSPHHLAVVYGQFRICKCCPVISSNWQIQKWLNKVAIYYATNLWSITTFFLKSLSKMTVKSYKVIISPNFALRNNIFFTN